MSRSRSRTIAVQEATSSINADTPPQRRHPTSTLIASPRPCDVSLVRDDHGSGWQAPPQRAVVKAGIARLVSVIVALEAPHGRNIRADDHQCPRIADSRTR